MEKKSKKIIRIAVIGVLVLGILGVGGFLYWQGGKTQENLPVFVNEAAKSYANALQPSHIDTTDPDNFGFETKLELDGNLIDNYIRKQQIFFGDTYTDLDGIITFRSNNYRNSAFFGKAKIENKKIDPNYWVYETGELAKSELTQDKGSDSWSGSGWTGQPLIVKWDYKTKQTMNLYADKKAKVNLTEVIYATLSGEIYFLDLQDGTPTRDTIKTNYAFKGAGSLDPRGIPLLYVGGGDASPVDNSSARVFIYSLIDGSMLYEFGSDDSFAPRAFHAYDSSALVDKNTDTLIYPGENGVLYTMKLNTNYDENAGTLSLAPDEILKFSYTTQRTRDNTKNSIQQLDDTYYLGMEDSAVFYENYMFIADNAGYMMCIDINTMNIVWAQDILDDTNSTPLFEEVNGEKYLYIAPSLHWEKKDDNTGIVNIYKLNAMTGDIIWKVPYDVHTVNGLSGGVQATGVLGSGEISDLVIYPVARTPYKRKGTLVALDKNTGERRWVFNMDNYAWSSPVAIYDVQGKAYIIQCDSKGNMFLLEGTTGKLLDKVNLGSNIEASPAVFGNTIVVGTRGKKIVGLSID